jgi:hypothetical protein
VSEHTRYPTARAAAQAQAGELRRRHLLRLAVALTVTALALLAPRLVHAQDWRTVSQSRQMSGERALRVDVEYGAGNLSLAPAARGTLYSTNLRYDANVFTPRMSYTTGRLRVGFEDTKVRGRNMRSGNLDLKLSPDVPLDLRLGFGAAEATIDLGGLRIQRALVQTGASKTVLNVAAPNLIGCELLDIQVGAARFEALRLGNLNAQRMTVQGGVGDILLDFSGTWQTDMSAKIEMGLGQLVLSLPRGLGVRVRKGGVLSSFDSQGLVKRGDMFYSENWDSAPRKLTIDLDAAFGSIKVVWTDS